MLAKTALSATRVIRDFRAGSHPTTQPGPDGVTRLIDRSHYQQELRTVTAASRDPEGSHGHQVAPAPIPLRTAVMTSPRHGPGTLGHGGLDLYAPMFAPCLLGCPGTPRQHPVSAASPRIRATAQNGRSRHGPASGNMS
jgi:hypothetical protein